MQRSILAPAAFAFTVLAGPAAAQTLPQPEPPVPPLAPPPLQSQGLKMDGRWRGSGGAALAATRGNSETSSALLSFELARATFNDKISFGGNLNQGRSRVEGEDKTTSDKWAVTGQYDHNLNPQQYTFVKLGFESDKLAQLDLRTTLALGTGYKLLDTKENSFALLAGAARSLDRYRSPVTIDGETTTRFARTSLFVGEESQHQLTASTLFKQRLEFYPGVSGDRAKLVKLNAGLGVAINSSMNLTVGVTGTYNSNPPDGQKRADAGLFTGVNVKLGAD